jgi:hypothetical protein
MDATTHMDATILMDATTHRDDAQISGHVVSIYARDSMQPACMSQVGRHHYCMTKHK